jgi:hypothetical protein
MIVVRSRHVGGHRIVRVFDDDVVSTGEHRTLGDAEFELRMAAAVLGANAILGFHYTTEGREEPSSSGQSTYRFRVFQAFGTPAIVEPAG